jgi:hypothetical protein
MCSRNGGDGSECQDARLEVGYLISVDNCEKIVPKVYIYLIAAFIEQYMHF